MFFSLLPSSLLLAGLGFASRTAEGLIPVSPVAVPRPPAVATTALFSTLAPTRSDIGISGEDGDGADEGGDHDPSPKKEQRKLRQKKGGISLTVDELAEEMGGSRGRARLAWDCYALGVDPALFFGSVIRLGQDDWETIYELLPTSRRKSTLGRDALDRLARLYSPYGGDEGRRLEGGVASLSHVSQSHDKTTKLLLRLSDGLEVETVVIPWKGSRSTLCVSSQIGCRQGCKFCATGKMGKLRSLTTDEILAQMFFALKICRLNNLPPVTNVVFMGMGEPADNSEAVTSAIDVLTNRDLFQLAASKVTVSTIGPTPEAFGDFAASSCVLAWSVHAVNDELRRQLVPSTRHTMMELRQGLIDALLRKPSHLQTCMLEVALLAGVNDGEKEADELAAFAAGISEAVPGCKLIVNLIPYNDIGDGQYSKPSQEKIVAFQKRLWSQGLHAHVRCTRGDDATAACGQLATTKKKTVKNNNDDGLSPHNVYGEDFS